VKARISEEVLEGSVFVPVHFPHVRINNLTGLSMNGEPPLTMVRIESST